MEGDGSSSQHHNDRNHTKKSSIVIQIPSYDDVLQSSQSNPSSSSLFVSSQSFTQAFASIKTSEFYSPPPLPRCNSLSSPSTESMAAAAASSRLSEVSLPATAATSSGFVQRTNAILVSNRRNSCALYLSLRYHLLHPDYLYYRIRELQKNFRLRVVLCHVDVEDVVKPLLEVTKTALLHDCTLLCGWSLEECGRYLETIKVYENKPADIIQGQMNTDYLSRLNHALTSIRHVNKTDVVTLGSTFGSLSHIMDASMEDLARCPGIGERKVKRLCDTFHEPFKRVIPTCVDVPETPGQNNSDPSSSEIQPPASGKESGDSSKRRKKEPELTVKSALSAAFAKYSEKLGKKDKRTEKENDEGSTVGTEGNADQ